MGDELPVDENGNYRLFTQEEMAAWTADDDDVIYTFGQSTPGCMVLLFGLGLIAFEGLVRWLA